MPITVKHTKVSTIPDDADTSLVRPSDWNADHTLVGLGTMAEQNANNVNITGGSITGVSGFGDVTGPASSTDNAIARFDSTTGKLLQNSVVAVGDTGAVTGVTTLAASTSVTTPIVQATNSAGLALRNSAGTTQISMGAGGGDNVTIAVATNINGANAQIDISPTGTGHVHIKPTGSGSLEIAPTNVGTINNMTIGATTARNASVVDLSVTGTTSFDGSQGTAGQVLTSAGAGATPTWATPTTGTVTSVTGTAPVVSSGGNTPAISMAAATGSVNGYLTSTDWTTFNNKGSGTVTSITAGTGLTGGTITTSGTIAIDSTVATLSDTQTLTNKTLTNPTITNYTETLFSPAANSSFTVALTDGTVQKFTTNANTTVTLPNSVAGKSFVIIIAYGGSHSITWDGGSVIKWAGGVTPTATAVNGKFDIFTFFQDGTNTYSSVLGQNY
jgi:hypothetical protein